MNNPVPEVAHGIACTRQVFNGVERQDSVNDNSGVRFQVNKSSFLALLFLLATANCGQEHLKVSEILQPEYPASALSQGIEGVVVVTVQIDTDGKVTHAGGIGPSWLLVHAAEENAQNWMFQVPQHARFPLDHKIRYAFRIDKQRSPNLSPEIVTDLPDSVEIIGSPSFGDAHVTIIPDDATTKKSHSAKSGQRK